MSNPGTGSFVSLAYRYDRHVQTQHHGNRPRLITDNENRPSYSLFLLRFLRNFCLVVCDGAWPCTVQGISEDVLPLKCDKLLITWNRTPKDAISIVTAAIASDLI